MIQLSDFTKGLIVDCYKQLRSCVDFEHIEDTDYICKAISYIEGNKPFLPKEILSNFEWIINKQLKPLVDEKGESFSSIRNPEYGHINDSGAWEFDSEEGMMLALGTLCQISIDISKAIEYWALENLSPYYI